jgi:hypothetical protein
MLDSFRSPPEYCPFAAIVSVVFAANGRSGVFDTTEGTARIVRWHNRPAPADPPGRCAEIGGRSNGAVGIS